MRTISLITLTAMVGFSSLWAVPVRETARETFDFDWKFARARESGEPALSLEAGAPGSPSESSYDDSAWRAVQLPHDWAIESPFLAEEPNETGKLPWNDIGWYRKEFTVPANEAGSRFYLDFDGVMSMPKVYVNGQFAGEWAYGYSSFRIDITDLLKFGEKNVISVRANNPPNGTRWYPGAGIYRHVWLTKSNPVHVDLWGVSITTPRISKNAAMVKTVTTVRNASDKPVSVKVSQRIGKNVRSTSQAIEIKPGATRDVELALNLPSPQLWELDKPKLYTLTTSIKSDEGVVDSVKNTFGVRKAEWKPDGFYLNGRRVYLKGVCQHHDLGPLGAAVYHRGIERQLEILKSFGVNSIRTSHNPPAPELLDLCDRMGILVDNEIFDIWEAQKYGKVNGYNTLWKNWHVKDVENFVRRDRNHPSVIMWSAGNEISEQSTARGKEVAKELVSLFKKHDPSRPVTCGCNDVKAWDNGFGEIFDIYGFNYKPKKYADAAKQRPKQPIIASETSSCVSTRGEYILPVKGAPQEINKKAYSWEHNSGAGYGIRNYQVSSYDLQAPGWGYRPDVEFAAQDRVPRIAGEYVWTGFDYLGEPTPYNQDTSNLNNYTDPEEQKRMMEQFEKLGNKAPSRSSYFGIVDLCGFPKDRYYLYRSRWLPEERFAHILPHWNWPERKGQVTPVHVYSSGDEAELFLNGKSLGKKKKNPGKEKDGYRFFWEDVVYEPGVLEVKVWKKGEAWASAKMETTGDAAMLKLKADRPKILGDARDISYITVSAADVQGRVVPTDKRKVKFSIAGPADIIGVCNGNPVDWDSMSGDSISIFNGLAQVIVRGKRGGEGDVTLTAAPEGLPPVTLKLKIEKASLEELKK